VPQAPQVPPFELRGPESSEELDPELLALPDPPRRERTLTVTVLAIAAVLTGVQCAFASLALGLFYLRVK